MPEEADSATVAEVRALTVVQRLGISGPTVDSPAPLAGVDAAGLDAVADRLTARLLADPVLSPLTSGSVGLRAAVGDLLSALVAGPIDARPVVEALAHLPIERRHVERAARALDWAMRAGRVPEGTREAVLARAAELGPSMVNARDRVERLREDVASHSASVASHSLYAHIRTIEDVRTFMEHHVFAVWDFMCLLKALQRLLTSVTTHWVPVGDPSTRRLINEIVVGEESDIDRDGRVVAHFELYVEGMREVGADTGPILRFVKAIGRGVHPSVAMHEAGVPAVARVFVEQTLEIVASDRPHAIAAAFTLGREELIPAMFLNLVHELNERFPGRLSTFTYYLERHIEVDGGEHAAAAMEMLENLCGGETPKWNESAGTAIAALRARRELWDGVEAAIQHRQAAASASIPSHASPGAA